MFALGVILPATTRPVNIPTLVILPCAAVVTVPAVVALPAVATDKLATCVVLVTVNGAVPVAILETNTGAVISDVAYMF